MRKVIVPKVVGKVKMSQIRAAVKEIKALRLNGELPKLSREEKKMIHEGIRLYAPR